MSMKYYVVDVFSDTPFMGNPVAVVICDAEIHDKQMQQIANWFNLSETSFVTAYNPAQQLYQVRIFTPTNELPFAGHPTLGTAVAVRHHFNVQENKLTQLCLAGKIGIRFSQSHVYLSTSNMQLSTLGETDTQHLSRALGIDETIEHAAKIDVGPVWLTALLQSANCVAQLQPDQALVAALSHELGAVGVVVAATQDNGKCCKVRTFAPAVGVPEDPICGSGNIALACLRRAVETPPRSYVAIQGQEVGRDGQLQLSYLGDDTIELGGKTCISASGKLYPQ